LTAAEAVEAMKLAKSQGYRSPPAQPSEEIAEEILFVESSDKRGVPLQIFLASSIMNRLLQGIKQ